MTAKLVCLEGTFSPELVERLFLQWRDDNAEQHRYTITFKDDGRAAFQFDQLKFNWFEVDPADLLRKGGQG